MEVTPDELEDKKNIIIKNTDTKAYHTYEEIMVDTLKKKIEEDKVVANKKAREKAKAEKEKRKEGLISLFFIIFNYSFYLFITYIKTLYFNLIFTKQISMSLSIFNLK